MKCIVFDSKYTRSSALLNNFKGFVLQYRISKHANIYMFMDDMGIANMAGIL
jgi:hypothetical protein